MQDSLLRFDANLKWLFTELPFEQRFDAAAAAGFTGVEYASPYGHAIADLKRRLTDAGLTQILINSPLGVEGSDTRRGLACLPDRVVEYRDSVELGLEYAIGLDAQVLHVVGGVRPEGVSRDRAFAQYVVNIAWAAERAADTGVKLVIEAQNKRDVPGFILESQARAAAVVEAIGDENVGLLFDVYHAQLDGGNVTETFQRLEPIVAHIQIADAPARHEPGSGELNWPYLFSAISRSDYAGWIGCEYDPSGETGASLGWMKEFTS